MPMTAAFPYVDVNIDLSGLMPTALRSPGVIAIVGETPDGADGGTATVNVPEEVGSLAEAANLFAKVANGVVAASTLYSSIEVALAQDPKPSKVYGVRVAAGKHAEGLAALNAFADVTFVALAGVVDLGTPAPPTGLSALKAHVEGALANGDKRIGVAMVDPATPKANDYADTVYNAVKSLESANGRMVLVAARGATGDAAVAVMSAIAGYQPQVSMVLKQITGVTTPRELQYEPSEITKLSLKGINAIIDPALIVGTGMHLSDAKLFGAKPQLAFIDVVRTLDDIDFRLKAGLIGLVGDARITAGGLIRVKSRIEGILGRLRRAAVIDGYSIDIPVLNLLSVPITAWDEADKQTVKEARENRSVPITVNVVYGPAVHRLVVALSPTFT